MEFMDNTDVGDMLKSDNALELGKQKAKELENPNCYDGFSPAARQFLRKLESGK